MSKSKGSDKKGSDKQYETIERKNISISVSAIGDPDVVGSLVANADANRHSTQKYSYDVSIADGNIAGGGGAAADMLLLVYSVADYRTALNFRGIDNLAILGASAESRIFQEPLTVPPGTLRSLMTQFRAPGTEIFGYGGPTAATALLGLYGKVNPEPFEKKDDKGGKSKKGK